MISSDDAIPPYAILAGKGSLPLELVQALLFSNHPFFLIGFLGQEEELREKSPVEPTLFSLGCIGEILSFLKKNQVKTLIFGGAIQRPSFSSLSLDKIGLKWLKKLGIKAFQGDDALLSGLVKLLEQEGFKIISPHSILSSLNPGKGSLTKIIPTSKHWRDIERGKKILQALSPHDIGQSIILEEGVVLGIEGAEGTSQLIERCAILRKNSKGGILVKMAKVGQSEKIDVPSIGLKTIQQLAKYNFNGVAFSSDCFQILQQEESVIYANIHKLFIIGV